MKKYFGILAMTTLGITAASCNNHSTENNGGEKAVAGTQPDYDSAFEVNAQSFADLQILRYQVAGFNDLSLKQKQLAYYLSEAALSGRDIFYDQMGQYNLMLRRTLENIYGTYTGDRNSDDWKKFQTYCGRFWFSYGFHHHYSREKFFPECTADYLVSIAAASDTTLFPMKKGEQFSAFIQKIANLIYNPAIEPKLVDLSPDRDVIKSSSINFYENVDQQDVERFYAKFNTKGQVPMWGLNSKLIKRAGKVFEETWRVGGLYSEAISKIVFWLKKAAGVAENDAQKKALNLLIQFYNIGDLAVFDQYSIAWLADTASRIDVVNGFIEVYEDPLGRKGSFESVVSMKDMEASKQINIIAANAQWFEDHSPLMDEHKKKNVKGIIAKAITVIQEGGRTSPATPIGINLPNNEWIRRDHGSKSVSLSNIIHAYNINSAASGMLDEFALNDEIKTRIRKYGNLASDLLTEMHEAIGHASGQINPGISTPDMTLKNYASALEEARADLVALYFGMDNKLVELGLMPSLEVGKAMYDNYMMNGLMTQLTRLRSGENLEEAHMRNRQLVAMWAFETGKSDNVVELVKKNGKTYVQINNYEQLRQLFGRLLREIQRVKSEGDFNAGRDLIETWGVRVAPVLHEEVLGRFAKLNIKPYKGFIQPKLIPVMDGKEITDVKLEYPDNFFDQMMEYGKNYSFLPVKIR